MKGWWLPWTFPVWLLGVVVLFAVFGDYAIFVALPRWPRWRFRCSGASHNPIDDPDADVNYWRFGGPWRP